MSTVILLCFLLFLPSHRHQQFVMAERVKISADLDSLRKRLLYQGRVYSPYASDIRGHQSFNELGIVPGSSLTFDGIRFVDIPLMYDVVKDELVTPVNEAGINLVVVKEFVSDFELGSHRFVHMKDQEMPTGYYRVLAESSVGSCVARITKHVHEQTSATYREKSFREQTDYFVKYPQNGNYKQVSSQRQLIRIFGPEFRRPLRQLLAKNSVFFREDAEAAIRLSFEFVEAQQ